MITKVLLLSVVAAAVANAQASAAMFRGDAAHSGRYAIGGERIVGLQWRVPTDGDVVATPVVANGVVYVGSGSGVMYALDKRTGEARWTVNLGSPVSSSAAVANSLVYVGTRDGRLHALDAASGRQKWWVPTGATIPFPWGHESGDLWTSSPTVANGLVLFGGGDGAPTPAGAFALHQRSSTSAPTSVRLMGACIRLTCRPASRFGATRPKARN
jgi:outer membrane protein assembly factor BamB